MFTLLQLCSAVVIAVLFCVQVETSCWFSVASPDENGNFQTSCEYQGWIFESGSTLKSPAPYCEECLCLDGSLHCCGYGMNAGVFNIPGCTQLKDNMSCNLKFVNSTDENLPCDLWVKK